MVLKKMSRKEEVEGKQEYKSGSRSDEPHSLSLLSFFLKCGELLIVTV